MIASCNHLTINNIRCLQITYPWLEPEGVSPRLVTNAGGKQSSAMARAMNFPTIYMYIQHWMSEQISFLVLNHKPALSYDVPLPHFSVLALSLKSPIRGVVNKDVILCTFSLAFHIFSFLIYL